MSQRKAAAGALYPTFQADLRTHRPRFLAVWGKHDPFFLPPGAEASRFVEVCSKLAEHLGEGKGIQRAGELLASWMRERVVHYMV